jgi:putative ABC transport system substrate-binding protein
MMARRAFLAGCVILTAPRAVIAQPVKSVYRLGILSAAAPTQPSPNFDAFREALRGLGWVEGSNISIETRYAEGDSRRLPFLAQDLVGRRMDIILPTSTPAAIAASEATGTIPIVMTGILDAQESGIVKDLARPGGNITGVTQISIQLIGKRLSLLKDAVPAVTRLGFLRAPPAALTGLPTTFNRILSTMEAATHQAGMELQTIVVLGADEIQTAFTKLAAARLDALYVLESPALQVHRVLIADLALRAKLPTIFGIRLFVDAGGLLSYGSDARDNFRHAALYVDKILKGARPGDLPVEQPTKFELVINLKTAKALGLTMPQSLLVRADEVID